MSRGRCSPGSRFWQTLPSPLRGGWENKLLARFLADFDRFKPKERISSVGCPIYIVAAERDDMVPLRLLEDAYTLIAHEQRKMTVRACGHFDLYVEPILEKNADLQAAFLARHLGLKGREPGAGDGEG